MTSTYRSIFYIKVQNTILEYKLVNGTRSKNIKLKISRFHRFVKQNNWCYWIRRLPWYVTSWSRLSALRTRRPVSRRRMHRFVFIPFSSRQSYLSFFSQLDGRRRRRGLDVFELFQSHSSPVFQQIKVRPFLGHHNGRTARHDVVRIFVAVRQTAANKQNIRFRYVRNLTSLHYGYPMTASSSFWSVPAIVFLLLPLGLLLFRRLTDVSYSTFCRDLLSALIRLKLRPDMSTWTISGGNLKTESSVVYVVFFKRYSPDKTKTTRSLTCVRSPVAVLRATAVCGRFGLPISDWGL